MNGHSVVSGQLVQKLGYSISFSQTFGLKLEDVDGKNGISSLLFWDG